MNAVETIINNEGVDLALKARLLSSGEKQTRETLELIIDAALKELNEYYRLINN
jgi:hypothetical protein